MFMCFDARNAGLQCFDAVGWVAVRARLCVSVCVCVCFDARNTGLQCFDAVGWVAVRARLCVCVCVCVCALMPGTLAFSALTLLVGWH